ncbi:MAG TPA: hypothetical protein VMJ32_10900, partial [Pirellulales bacterium]|nr:hypothetical protein [Pirellulales bacterium]
ILALGIGLNWTVSWHDRETPSDHAEIASTTDPRTIVEVAVAIGNVTDAETGSQLARQLTALTGAPLNPQQAAALEQEVQRRVKGGFLGRKEGSS